MVMLLAIYFPSDGAWIPQNLKEGLSKENECFTDYCRLPFVSAENLHIYTTVINLRD